jgi:antitoxin component of MazEF toxin-antitoxin module
MEERGENQMANVTRKADKKGRVLLFPDFAGQLVIVERIGEDEVRLKKATTARRRRKYTLAQLLAGVTPENIHPEVDFGRPRGKEAW